MSWKLLTENQIHAFTYTRGIWECYLHQAVRHHWTTQAWFASAWRLKVIWECGLQVAEVVEAALDKMREAGAVLVPFDSSAIDDAQAALWAGYSGTDPEAAYEVGISTSRWHTCPHHSQDKSLGESCFMWKTWPGGKTSDAVRSPVFFFTLHQKLHEVGEFELDRRLHLQALVPLCSASFVAFSETISSMLQCWSLTSGACRWLFRHNSTISFPSLVYQLNRPSTRTEYEGFLQDYADTLLGSDDLEITYLSTSEQIPYQAALFLKWCQRLYDVPNPQKQMHSKSCRNDLPSWQNLPVPDSSWPPEITLEVIKYLRRPYEFLLSAQSDCSTLILLQRQYGSWPSILICSSPSADKGFHRCGQWQWRRCFIVPRWDALSWVFDWLANFDLRTIW